MAVQIFEIKWEGFLTIDGARTHRIARGSGIYICYKTVGGKKKPKYIGKSKNLGARLGDHKQGLMRFDQADAKKATFMLGEILDYGGDRVSADIDDTQLGDIETFLISKVPNDNPSQKPYKGDSIIIVNTGKTVSLDSVIAHNTATLELISKGIRNRKTKQPKTRKDPLFDVGRI